jgi:hypothetical protein
VKLLDLVPGNLNGSPYITQIWDVSSPNEQYFTFVSDCSLIYSKHVTSVSLSLQDISPPPAHKHAPLHIMVQ